jgi:16S rRNA (adenine1518-N6/adenine1519-N6)-dimethyltransferase
MEPRQLLRRYGLAAKKSWGQNFLISERVYQAIVDAAVGDPGDCIVEIGAGLGTLTVRLAARVPAGRVFAIERDRELVHVLHGELGGIANVAIVEADARRFNYATAAEQCGQRLVVCGNLPYHLTATILFSLVASRRWLRRSVVMIQREVADRLLASPGGRQCGAITSLLSAYADVSLVVRARPGAFLPAPKVESAVIRLDWLDEPRVAIDDPDRYAAVVHAAFAQRRKTLRNALRSAFAEPAVERALLAAGIDGSRRGETLTVAEFAALAHWMSDARAP